MIENETTARYHVFVVFTQGMQVSFQISRYKPQGKLTGIFFNNGGLNEEKFT